MRLVQTESARMQCSNIKILLIVLAFFFPHLFIASYLLLLFLMNKHRILFDNSSTTNLDLKKSSSCASV